MSKKSEITEYFVFNREWYELKKTVSNKVWDELFDLMLQLRFDGVDTDPQTIKSKTVRSYWVMIRVRILNSMERCERKKEERKRKMETNSKSQQDIPSNTEFDTEPENSPNKTVITAEYPNPQPKNESPSERQESGKNEVLEYDREVDDAIDSLLMIVKNNDGHKKYEDKLEEYANYFNSKYDKSKDDIKTELNRWTKEKYEIMKVA